MDNISSSSSSSSGNNNNNNKIKIKPNLIDLKDHYDYNLLKRFYQELVIPNFPNEHELEPLENWVEMFNENDNNNNSSGIGSNDNNSVINSDNMNGSGNNNNEEEEEEEEDNLISIIGGSSKGSGVFINDGQVNLYNNQFEFIKDGANDIYSTTSDSGEDEDKVDFHILLAICPQEHIIPGESNILGGVVFEYYPSINCGCITYLLVNTNYRGQGFAAILLKEASNSLMYNGKARGHLSGCNAIFLETNSAEKVKPEDDVMDPAKRHSIFYKLGIRLLDFDYIQPPLSNESGKCKDLLLTCLLTPSIPKQVFGKEERYYLPSSLLLNFLKVFWASCYSRLDNQNWEQDVDFKRMMDQLNRRERIPLLDLPWSRPWTLVDLRDSFDSKQLITKFYNQVLVPNYPGVNELDPLDFWFKMLDDNNKNEDFHLLVALRYHEDEDTLKQEPIICGGLAFEYHKETNCGLLTYFLVGDGPNNRSEVMARALIQRAVDILEQNAIDRGNLAGCNIIYLESNEIQNNNININNNNISSSSSDNNIIKTNKCNTIETNITEISYKKEFLFNMGWRKLDIQYIQPPLSNENIKSKSLNLLVLITPRIPTTIFNGSDQHYYYLPNSLVESFIIGFWESTSKRNHQCNKLANWYANDIDYKIMLDSISRRDRIPLLSSLEHWNVSNNNKSIILIDLAVDFHQDLFDQFYSLLPIDLNIENKDQLEKILKLNYSNSTTTYQLKSSDSRKSEDIHLLLAVSYFNSSSSSSSSSSVIPTILGASIFSYLLNSNCGIISNLLVHSSNIIGCGLGDKQKEFRIIDKILLSESVSLLNKISKSKTHISGPNSIFFESITYSNNSSSSNNNNNSNQKDKLIESTFSIEIQNQNWYIIDINYYKLQRSININNSNSNSNSNNNQISLLCALKTEQLPKFDESKYYIPKDLLRVFIKSYWASLFTRSQISIDQFSKSETNIKMNQQTKSRDKFLLLDINNIVFNN